MVQFTTYICPTCGKSAKIPGGLQLKCKICNNVICYGCSKNEICQVCQSQMTPSQSDRIKAAANKSRMGEISICVAFLVGGIMFVLMGIITDSLFVGILSLIVCAVVGLVFAARMRSEFIKVCDQVVNELKNN